MTPDPTEEKDDDSLELTDLTILCTTSSAAEAALISSILDDEDIPSVVQGEHTGTMFGGASAFYPKICVPRGLLEKAKEVLANARQHAQTQGIDQAFEPQSEDSEDPGNSPDKEVRAASLLADLNPDEREQELRVMIPQWVGRGDSVPEIAIRLASAGLNREEADKLMISIQNDQASLDAARHRRFVIGLILTLCGLGLIAIGPFGYGIVLSIAGAGISASSFKLNSPQWEMKDKSKENS